MTGVSAGFDAALAAHLDLLRRRDLEGFAATLSQRDCRSVGPRGRLIDGYDAVRAAHAEWFAFDDRWTFATEVLWEHAGDDLAVALLAVTYTPKPGGAPDTFRLTLTFAREDGVWRRVLDQTTPCTAETPEKPSQNTTT